jgi:hypothetical protein
MAKQKVRRAVIRDWMSRASHMRQSAEQAAAFATGAAKQHPLPRRRRSGFEIIMAWLRPRTGRP